MCWSDPLSFNSSQFRPSEAGENCASFVELLNLTLKWIPTIHEIREWAVELPRTLADIDAQVLGQSLCGWCVAAAVVAALPHHFDGNKIIISLLKLL